MRTSRFAMFVGLALAASVSSAAPPLVEVWKSDSCGCCGEWVKHLQKSGFATRIHRVEDPSPMRRALGLPDRLGSCHTARVGGYVIEGHVPASDIKRLLAERPEARGLAAPGMPAGSPGMDVPGSPPFETLLVDKEGAVAVYARHEGLPAR